MLFRSLQVGQKNDGNYGEFITPPITLTVRVFVKLQKLLVLSNVGPTCHHNCTASLKTAAMFLQFSGFCTALRGATLIFWRKVRFMNKSCLNSNHNTKPLNV